jgi:hypothetical protein
MYFTAISWIIKCMAIDSNISVIIPEGRPVIPTFHYSPNMAPVIGATVKFTQFTLRYGIHAVNHPHT